jgi:hypothetical protein
MLVVVSLLAAVLMGVMTRISRQQTAAQWSEAIFEVRHLDLRARFLARTGGALWWVSSAPNRFELRRAETGERLRQVDLPFPAQLGPERAIFFDAGGRSEDFEVRVSDGERTVRMAVLGLTCCA